jgi:hypothetical protein
LKGGALLTAIAQHLKHGEQQHHNFVQLILKQV